MLYQDYDKEIENLKDANKDLQKENERLKQIIKAYQVQFKQIKQEKKNLSEEKDVLNRRVLHLEKKRKEQDEYLTSQKDMFAQTSNYLTKVIEELQESKEEIEMQKDVLVNTVTDLEEKRDEIEMQKNVLLVTVKDLEESKEEIAAQKDVLESTIEELAKSKEEIAVQNKLLEGTFKELDDAYSNITASINYAKRIQEAMLPQVESIEAVFQDCFVLFKPRDIVSGDFYWFTQKNNKIIIAAIDCTGHGVPGAFMSMIGNDLLHQIVDMREILHADQILNELHRGVRTILKQGESENRDGMDVALCVIDKEQGIMEFAGAHNPILVIQNGETKYVKADKMAIGGYQREGERIFQKKVFSIEQETTFYIYSDGYQDQFGGPSGRKFMAKRMRQILCELYDKPMKRQKRVLDRIINFWMKGHPQLDDILIMGIKI